MAKNTKRIVVLQYYLHGPEGGYHPKMNRLDRLKLTYFQGNSDKLTEDLLQVRIQLKTWMPIFLHTRLVYLVGSESRIVRS